MVTTGLDHSVFDRSLMILENEHARTEDKIAACSELQGYFDQLIRNKTDLLSLPFKTNGEKLIKILLHCIEKENYGLKTPVLLALKPALQLLPKGLSGGMQVASQCYSVLFKSSQTTEENVSPSCKTRVLVELFRCMARFSDPQFVDAVKTTSSGYENHKMLIDKCLNLKDDHIDLNGSEDHQDGDLWNSYLKLETLSFISRVMKVCGSLLCAHFKDDLDFWLELLLPPVFVFHESSTSILRKDLDSDIRRAAREALEALLSIVPKDEQLNLDKWPKIKKDIKDSYGDKMVKLVGNASDWATIWCLVLDVLGSELVRKGNNHLINKLLNVEERAFKYDRSEVRVQAFICWRHLIDKLLPSISEVANDSVQRSVRLLVQPLQPSNAKTDLMSRQKLNTWWHLVQRLEKCIENHQKTVLVPFLQYCFGSSKLKEQPPGKKFPSLHVPCGQALAHILNLEPVEVQEYFKRQKEFENIEKCNIHPCSVPLLSKPSVFLDLSEDLIYSVGECIIILSNNSEEASNSKLLDAIWKSLLRHVKIVLDNGNFPAERTIKLVQDLLRLVQNITERSSCATPSLASQCISLLLEGLVMGPHALPANILSSSVYYVGTAQLMTGTPALFLMEIMISRPLLQLTTSHLRYIPVLKAILELGISHHNVLEFMHSVMKQLENVASAYSNVNSAERTSLCVVWNNIARVLVSYLKEHNQVNQGNDKHHDLSCFYLVVLFPFYHLYNISYRQTVETLAVWRELYKYFHETAVHSIATLDINEVCETVAQKMCQALSKHCPSSADQAVSLVKAIQSIIMSIPFADVCENQHSKSKSKYILLPDRGRGSKPTSYITNTMNLVIKVSQLFSSFERSGEWYNTSLSVIMTSLEILLKNMKTASIAVAIPIVSTLSDSVLILLQATPLEDVTLKFWQGSLQRMWKCYLTFVETYVPHKSVKDFLSFMSPLLETGFRHSQEEIRTITVEFWDNIFVPAFAVDNTVIPNSLKEARSKSSEKISLAPDPSLTVNDNASDININQLDSKEKPQEPVVETVFAVPEESDTSKDHRSLIQKLQDEGHILTKHQKEVFRRRKDDIPALYNSTLQPMQEDSILSETSQDTSEFGAPQRIIGSPKSDMTASENKEETVMSKSLKVLEPPSSLRRMADYRKKMMIDHEGSIVLASVTGSNSTGGVNASDEGSSTKTSDEIVGTEVKKEPDVPGGPLSLTFVSDSCEPTSTSSNGRKLNLEFVAVPLSSTILMPNNSVSDSTDMQLVVKETTLPKPEMSIRVSISTPASTSVTSSGINSPLTFPLEGPAVSSGNIDGSDGGKNSNTESLQTFEHVTKTNRKPVIVSTESPLTNVFKPVSITFTHDDDEISCSGKGLARTIYLETPDSSITTTAELKTSCVSSQGTLVPISSVCTQEMVLKSDIATHNNLEHNHISLEDAMMSNIEVFTTVEESDIQCEVPECEISLDPVKVVVEKVEDYSLTKSLSALETLTLPFNVECQKESPPSHEVSSSSRRKTKSPLKRNPGDPKLPPFKRPNKTGLSVSQKKETFAVVPQEKFSKSSGRLGRRKNSEKHKLAKCLTQTHNNDNVPEVGSDIIIVSDLDNNNSISTSVDNPSPSLLPAAPGRKPRLKGMRKKSKKSESNLNVIDSIVGPKADRTKSASKLKPDNPYEKTYGTPRNLKSNQHSNGKILVLEEKVANDTQLIMSEIKEFVDDKIKIIDIKAKKAHDSDNTLNPRSPKIELSDRDEMKQPMSHIDGSAETVTKGVQRKDGKITKQNVISNRKSKTTQDEIETSDVKINKTCSSKRKDSLKSINSKRNPTKETVDKEKCINSTLAPKEDCNEILKNDVKVCMSSSKQCDEKQNDSRVSEMKSKKKNAKNQNDVTGKIDDNPEQDKKSSSEASKSDKISADIGHLIPNVELVNYKTSCENLVLQGPEEAKIKISPTEHNISVVVAKNDEEKKKPDGSILIHTQTKTTSEAASKNPSSNILSKEVSDTKPVLDKRKRTKSKRYDNFTIENVPPKKRRRNIRGGDFSTILESFISKNKSSVPQQNGSPEIKQETDLSKPTEKNVSQVDMPSSENKYNKNLSKSTEMSTLSEQATTVVTSSDISVNGVQIMNPMSSSVSEKTLVSASSEVSIPNILSSDVICYSVCNKNVKEKISSIAVSENVRDICEVKDTKQEISMKKAVDVAIKSTNIEYAIDSTSKTENSFVDKLNSEKITPRRGRSHEKESTLIQNKLLVGGLRRLRSSANKLGEQIENKDCSDMMSDTNIASQLEKSRDVDMVPYSDEQNNANKLQNCIVSEPVAQSKSQKNVFLSSQAQRLSRRNVNKLAAKTSVVSKESNVALTESKEMLSLPEAVNGITGTKISLDVGDSQDIIECSQESSAPSVISGFPSIQKCSVSICKLDTSLEAGATIDVSQGDQKLVVLIPEDSSSPFKVYTPDERSPNRTHTGKLEKTLLEVDHTKLIAATRSLYGRAADVKGSEKMNKRSNTLKEDKVNIFAEDNEIKVDPLPNSRNDDSKLKSKKQITESKLEESINNTTDNAAQPKLKQMTDSVTEMSSDRNDGSKLRSKKQITESKTGEILSNSKVDSAQPKSKQIIGSGNDFSDDRNGGSKLRSKKQISQLKTEEILSNTKDDSLFLKSKQITESNNTSVPNIVSNDDSEYPTKPISEKNSEDSSVAVKETDTPNNIVVDQKYRFRRKVSARKVGSTSSSDAKTDARKSNIRTQNELEPSVSSLPHTNEKSESKSKLCISTATSEGIISEVQIDSSSEPKSKDQIWTSNAESNTLSVIKEDVSTPSSAMKEESSKSKSKQRIIPRTEESNANVVEFESQKPLSKQVLLNSDYKSMSVKDVYAVTKHNGSASKSNNKSTSVVEDIPIRTKHNLTTSGSEESKQLLPTCDDRSLVEEVSGKTKKKLPTSKFEESNASVVKEDFPKLRSRQNVSKSEDNTHVKTDTSKLRTRHIATKSEDCDTPVTKSDTLKSRTKSHDSDTPFVKDDASKSRMTDSIGKLVGSNTIVKDSSLKPRSSLITSKSDDVSTVKGDVKSKNISEKTEDFNHEPSECRSKQEAVTQDSSTLQEYPRKSRNRHLMLKTDDNTLLVRDHPKSRNKQLKIEEVMKFSIKEDISKKSKSKQFTKSEDSKTPINSDVPKSKIKQSMVESEDNNISPVKEDTSKRKSEELSSKSEESNSIFNYEPSKSTSSTIKTLSEDNNLPRTKDNFPKSGSKQSLSKSEDLNTSTVKIDDVKKGSKCGSNHSESEKSVPICTASSVSKQISKQSYIKNHPDTVGPDIHKGKVVVQPDSEILPMSEGCVNKSQYSVIQKSVDKKPRNEESNKTLKLKQDGMSKHNSKIAIGDNTHLSSQSGLVEESNRLSSLLLNRDRKRRAGYSELSFEVPVELELSDVDESINTAVLKIRRLSQNEQEMCERTVQNIVHESTPPKAKCSDSGTDKIVSPKDILNSPKSLLQQFSSSSSGNTESKQNRREPYKQSKGGRAQYLVGLAISEKDLSPYETSQATSLVPPQKPEEMRSISAETPPLLPLSRKKLLYGTGAMSPMERLQQIDTPNCETPSPDCASAEIPFKRVLKHSSNEQGTLPSKKKRVSFSEPLVSKTNYFTIGRHASAMMQKKAELKILRKAAKLQLEKKRNAMMQDTSPVSAITNSPASIAPMNLSLKAIPSPSQNSPDLTGIISQGSVEDSMKELLNSQDAIFPPLISCTHPIENVAPKLTTHPMWIKALLTELNHKRVTTIGDLSRLDEVSIDRLPIIKPKISHTRKILQEYLKSLEMDSEDERLQSPFGLIGRTSRSPDEQLEHDTATTVSLSPDQRLGTTDIVRFITSNGGNLSTFLEEVYKTSQYSDMLTQELCKVLAECPCLAEQTVHSYLQSQFSCGQIRKDFFEKLFPGDWSEILINAFQTFLMQKRTDGVDGTIYRYLEGKLQRMSLQSVMQYAISRLTSIDKIGMCVESITLDNTNEVSVNHFQKLLQAISKKVTYAELTKMCCSVLMEKVSPK